MTPQPSARVLIGDEEFKVAHETPFVFGRADADGVVGLDADDMRISAIAGAVEFGAGVWWIINRSSKNRLLIDDGTTVQPRRLEHGMRHALTSEATTVLVPGGIYTHRLEIVVPRDDIPSVAPSHSSGTLTADDVVLSRRDREVLAALFRGYLLEFPHRDPRPRTYRQAADALGDPWTSVTVRKQVERLKERLRNRGLYFEGPRANDELAEHLLAEGALTKRDLDLLGDAGTDR